MKLINKDDFLRKSLKTLGELYDMFSNLPKVELKDFQSKSTALVIVDMINGFARVGALKSPRVEALIPKIVELSKSCDRNGILKLALADCHCESSPEFNSYPTHCLTGSEEGEIVKEIEEVGGYVLVFKNSTNGFIEKDFQKWLKDNSEVDTFIITGDCTDICVEQLAITLKTWFNMHNRKTRIIVPISAVDTYDLGLHDGDFMNITALHNMAGNGIEIVSDIV